MVTYRKTKSVKEGIERFDRVINNPTNYGIPNLQLLNPDFDISIDYTKNKHNQVVIYLTLGKGILIFTEKNIFDYRTKCEIDELSNIKEFEYKFQSFGFKDWCRSNRIIYFDYQVIVRSLSYAFSFTKQV